MVAFEPRQEKTKALQVAKKDFIRVPPGCKSQIKAERAEVNSKGKSENAGEKRS